MTSIRGTGPVAGWYSGRGGDPRTMELREDSHDSLTARFRRVSDALTEACHDFYGDRLITLAVFGSVGRDTMRPDSDIDILIVAEPLPRGRIRRVEEFAAVERRIGPHLATASKHGVQTRLSPVFKTPEEVRRGSPLFLDMSEDARILHDRDRFFERQMDGLRHRLRSLGARRLWKGDAWYWDLKPDYRPGEVFEI